MSIRVEVIFARESAARPLTDSEDLLELQELRADLPTDHGAVVIDYDEALVIHGTPGDLLKLAHQILTAARAARARTELASHG